MNKPCPNNRIGDGQVSDKKMWNVKDISKMLKENA